jgi:hydroxymethylglutaryl-CoA lyase
MTALSAGIRTIDSSVGGLGGCPYSPGATGNVATEDVLYVARFTLQHLTLRRVTLMHWWMSGFWISDKLGRGKSSRVAKAIRTCRERGVK